jgi:hypothetical protein
MEVAIPIFALGGLYLVSNQEKKKKEGFSTLNTPSHRLQPSITGRHAMPNSDRAGAGVSTYNRRDLEEEPAFYPAPNHYGDRYFQEHTATWTGEPTGTGIESLSGSVMSESDFRHNNMQPYFGSRVRQSGHTQNTHELILDQKQGTGSQHIQKQEQSPLFRPEENMNWNTGMPNQSDFIQSRINPVLKMANVKPFKSERVAPGLGLGAGTEGSGGFNSGMEARDLWMPKTVDELRVANKPKETYAGQFLGGKTAVQNRAEIGNVEKNRPDTYYINEPDRYFTTTGQEKAPTSRSAQVMKEQTRIHQEHYGVAKADKNASYVKPKFRVSTRPELDAPITHASNIQYIGSKVQAGEYGLSGAQNSVITNNRSTTEQPREGGLSTFARAMVAPLLDVLRPSRKENVIGNIRGQGNMHGNYGHYTNNPADRTKTTIREMTEANPFQMNVGNSGLQAPQNYDQAYAQTYGQNRDTSRAIIGNAGAEIKATQTYDQVYAQVYGQNRDTTNKQILGNAGGINAPTVREHAENAYLIDKSEISKGRQPMGSNAPLFNGQSFTNVQTAKMDTDRHNPRLMVPQGTRVPQAPAVERYGQFSTRSEYGQNIHLQRNQPEILDAFHSNPYTKPLNVY